jgi:hypothetical protein
VLKVENAIKRLNNNQSLGPDGIPVELIKRARKDLLEGIHRIIVKAWVEEVHPEEWEEVCICPTNKMKGDQLECGNY